MDTSGKILEHITTHGQATSKQLIDSLGIAERTVRHNLANLVASGKLVKVGIRPNVIYSLSQPGQPVQSVAPQNTATPQTAVTTPAQEVKAVKAAPNQIQPLGQEFLPNWCQKFGIDPAVVISRYEAVRGFIPGLSPRGRSSAKKKLLAVLYSGIVLTLVFLSVWATGTGPKPMRWVKIAGLILIAGIIYVIVFQPHRFTPHQSRLWRDQEETAKLKEQLADNQNQLSQVKEQLASNQADLNQMKEQLLSAQGQLNDSQSESRKTTEQSQTDLRQMNEKLSSSQDELAKTKEQLTQEQEERKNLEGQIKTLQEENQHLSKALRPDSGQAQADTQRLIQQVSTEVSTGQVTISQIIDWTKEGVPANVIIKSVKDSRSHYTLTPEDIYYLKKQGVSDSVIEAMSNQANSTDAQVPRQGPYNKSTGQGLVQKVKGFITNMGGL